MINYLNNYFVTMFGIGYIKKIPGTVSSFVTVVFLLIYFHYFDLSKNLFLFILSLVFFYSFIAVNLYVKNKTNKDPKEVVIDEFIGQSIPIYLYEVSHGTDKTFNESIYIYFVIFILFRLFDIKKPFPVSYFDKNFKNSFGVVMDDVIAGLYVVLVLIISMVIKSYFSL
ncbi:phosphatidylglycerophosphatase A [Pelagibacterales bacterium SAG-MED15]|nr:phosphatidylglycerophosphatase A [Pelagibacterales bacterium SAG-MED15]